MLTKGTSIRARSAALIAALTFSFATPALAGDPVKFDARILSDYIESFEVSEMSRAAKRESMQIAHDPTLSHFDKVLELHTLLKSQNALRHVPMHRVSPSYAGLDYRDTGA